MKPMMLLAVGACGGALAAFFLFPALDSGQFTLTSADSSFQSANPAAGDVSDPLASIATSTIASPGDALREVSAIEADVIQISTAVRIAEIWARRDPGAAMAAAELLPEESRTAYESAVAREWSFYDPAGFFAHAEAASSIDTFIAGLEALIATDPERVWAIAERFQGQGNPEIDALNLHAVRGMASRDPAATIARLESVASGPRRDPILASIAEAYSVIDADAALAWAISVVPPSSDALGKVLEVVAAEDLMRAYELVRQVPNPAVDVRSLGAAMAGAALRGRQSPGVLASSFAERGEPDADIMLSGVMQQWAQLDPESAVEWMAGNEAYLTNELTRAVVFYLAFEDVGLAAELVAHVPASAQDQWLDEVAFRYGQFDVDQAMSWLSGYQGRAGYEALVARTLGGVLLSDAPFVANYIETSGIDFDANFVAATARDFAEQDPQSAIQWATRLGDAERSAVALEGVVDRWAQTDGVAATRWVLSQPRGAERDRILNTMMLISPISQGVDAAAVFDAFDSSANAQRALTEFIFRSTRVPRSMLDASIARAEPLVEFLTDPAAREQAQEQIAAAKR